MSLDTEINSRYDDAKKELDALFKTRDSKLAKLMGFWLPAGLLTLAMVCFGIIFWSIPTPISTLPVSVIPEYRTIETGGGFFGGHTEYFIFGTDGTRYFVTQKLFDQYKDLQRGDK